MKSKDRVRVILTDINGMQDGSPVVYLRPGRDETWDIEAEKAFGVPMNPHPDVTIAHPNARIQCRPVFQPEEPTTPTATKVVQCQ
jgi:hypothetical protein